MTKIEPIIYIDGALADAMGSIHMRALAQRAATLGRQPVTLLTHGASELHSDQRFTSKPLPLGADDNVIEEAVRRLRIAKLDKKPARDATIESVIALLTVAKEG